MLPRFRRSSLNVSLSCFNAIGLSTNFVTYSHYSFCFFKLYLNAVRSVNKSFCSSFSLVILVSNSKAFCISLYLIPAFLCRSCPANPASVHEGDLIEVAVVQSVECLALQSRKRSSYSFDFPSC
jgi:hypothetical protein